MTYMIIRMYLNRPNKVIKTGLTLEGAQEYCRDPETSNSTCKNPGKSGPWFDGYEKEST